MIDRATFQRTHALALSVEKLIRPTHVADGHLHGLIWRTDLGHEVPIRLPLPKNMDPDDALQAVAAGNLVLDRSGRRLTRSWG